VSVVEAAYGSPDEILGPTELPFDCGNGVWGEAGDCLGRVWDRRWYQETCWVQLCLVFGSVTDGPTPGDLVFTGWTVTDLDTGGLTRSPAIGTSLGIGIGSSRDEILASYPGTTFSKSVGNIETFDIGWTNWSGTWPAPGVLSFDNLVIHFAGGDGPDLAGF
jgi:hypothetical protein